MRCRILRFPEGYISLYFETEMYHAAAKSFVRVWLSVMRERTVLPYDCACADEFTGGEPKGRTPGHLLLPFGQFTLCRACGDETACVAERYLTLRTGCERHGRKNPLPFPMSKRSHVGNLHQIRKQGKGRSSKRKENRRLSFLFAPAAGAATLPPSADGESPRLIASENSPTVKGETPARFV